MGRVRPRNGGVAARLVVVDEGDIALLAPLDGPRLVPGGQRLPHLRATRQALGARIPRIQIRQFQRG